MKLNDLFDAERKRIFEPDALFAKRVLARLNESRRNADFGFWDAVPSSARPVLALALILVLCFIAAEVFIPQMPQFGVVESFLAPDQNSSESFLYNDNEVPSRTVVLEQ